MSKDLISVTPDDTMSKLVSLFETHRFREMLVIEKKKLVGIIYSKEIARKDTTQPDRTKVSALIMSPPPCLKQEQDMSEAAKAISSTGLRALPVMEGGKVIGIVSLHDIVDAASKSSVFKKTPAEAIMSAPEVIQRDSDIGTARMLMRSKNISRLPVVESDGKLYGVVTIFDLLKAVKPVERMNFFSMSAEKERTMDIPVSAVLDTHPVTVVRDDTLSDVVSRLRKSDVDGAIVVDSGFPVGIVTEKDLLEVYMSGLGQKGVYYQISGIGEEDAIAAETADRMVRDTIEKLSKVYEPQFFFVHIKRYSKEGKVKYSIRTRFMTNKGIFMSRSFAWDLREAVNESLKKLERMMLNKREQVRQRSRFKSKSV